jgi:hypothetical protein
MQCSQLWGTLRGFGLAGVSPMRRACSRVIALIAMVACLSVTANAADTTLTLACKGTETRKSWDGARKSSEVINIGLIVDFQKKTIIGLSDSLLTIVGVTETTISFEGAEAYWNMNGTLDRVTGSLVAASGRSNPNLTLSYDLQCRPTQRMF